MKNIILLSLASSLMFSIGLFAPAGMALQRNGKRQVTSHLSRSQTLQATSVSCNGVSAIYTPSGSLTDEGMFQAVANQP